MSRLGGRWSLATAIVLAIAASVSATAPVASAVGSGSLLWAKRYDGPANGADHPSSVAFNPDGSTVFVTGHAAAGGSLDYATLAYDVTNGALHWVQRYDGPASGDDEASSIAVSPDGSTVFVTGRSNGGATAKDYATVAYDASSGAVVWAKRYDGPASGDDEASSIAVSPDGSTVFVTGGSDGVSTLEDYATVAYAASTGTKIWTKRYDGPASGSDVAAFLGVSPDGSTVFVTGGSDGGSTFQDYATVAYAASTGTKIWTKRYDGPASGSDVAASLGVSPDGSTVFVTGGSYSVSTLDDYATVAYHSSSGKKIWSKRYDGAGGPGHDTPSSLAVSPGGSAIFVTGYSYGGSTTYYDYATVAYASSNGARLWARRYDGPASGNDVATALAVSPDGTNIFVTGRSYGVSTLDDYGTIEYAASTGATGWAKRYDGPASGYDDATSLAVRPVGPIVCVTGESDGGVTTGNDYATVAYAP